MSWESLIYMLVLGALALLIAKYTLLYIYQYHIMRRPMPASQLVTLPEDFPSWIDVPSRDRFCVVGAGFGGLGMGTQLKMRLLPFHILEKTTHYGGNWSHRVYSTVHMISSKKVTEFKEYPMDKTLPIFPSAKQLWQYLSDYTNHFRLHDQIQYDSTVLHVDPLTAQEFLDLPDEFTVHPGQDGFLTPESPPDVNKVVRGQDPEYLRIREPERKGAKVVPEGDADGRFGYKVTIYRSNAEDGGNPINIVRRYKGVIIANGHDWDPRIPSYPGNPTMEIIHSVKYYDPSVLQDKRVLVVGGGTSACDIAVEASRVGKSSHISMRRGYWILPRILFGRPVAEVFQSWIPLCIQQLIFELGLYIAVGRNSDFGLPNPKFTVFEHTITINNPIIEELAKGNIIPHGDLVSLDGNTVTFKDGNKIEVDLVVLATGHHTRVPMIEHLVEHRKGAPQFLNGITHPNYRNLYFFGLGHARHGAGSLFSCGGEVICCLIKQQEKLVFPVGKTLKHMGSKFKTAGQHTEEVIIDPHRAFGQAWFARHFSSTLPWWERTLFSKEIKNLKKTD